MSSWSRDGLRWRSALLDHPGAALLDHPGAARLDHLIRAQPAVGVLWSGAFSGKWQATRCPGASSSNGGSCVLQMSCAFQHRVWNRHAGGGLIGLGTSPWSRIRSRWVRR